MSSHPMVRVNAVPCFCCPLTIRQMRDPNFSGYNKFHCSLISLMEADVNTPMGSYASLTPKHYRT